MQQSTCFGLIELGVSHSRLARYGAGKDPEAEVVARYLWNVALTESLYPALNHFEIALRNAIHREASRYRKSSMWFLGKRSNSRPLLLPREENQILKARSDLVSRNKPITPDGIVAELHLGFWTALLYKPYAAVLYTPIARSVFPGATPSQIQRGSMELRLKYIREFRNRVFHHEPIWDRPTLAHDYTLILETIEWISPPLHATVTMMDRFPGVFAGKLTPYQTDYNRLIASLPP